MNSKTSFFPRMFCSGHIKHAKCNAGLFQKDFTCTELLLLCSRLGLLITLVKEGGAIMCVCTQSSDPAHPIFWHKCLPNEEQIENPKNLSIFQKKM